MINALFAALAIATLSQPQPAPSAPAAPKASAPAAMPQPAASDGPYALLRTFEVGGEGGWDIVTVDSAAGRLYVPRGTHVMVIDTNTGKVAGDIPGTDGVHGVAVAPELGKGFTSNGKSGDVTVFELATLKVIQTVKAGTNPDAIVFEPKTKRVLCFNGRSSDATVISAESLSPLGAIALGGKPEFAAMAGDGTVFVNLEDKSEVLKLDAEQMKVLERWPLAPGKEPTGLAIDPAHHRLYAACGNEMMVVLDSQTGKVVATPAIGKRPDGAEFDVTAGLAMAPSGEGTLTVIGPTLKDQFGVVQTLKTQRGARTLVLDPKTRLVYLPTADYEAAKEGERPKMKPGTFKVLVVGPAKGSPERK